MKKKLLIQTLLLITPFVILWVSPRIYMANYGIFYDVVYIFAFAFFHLSLFIFIPVTALYFMRRRSDKSLGKIFRFTAYLISLTLTLLFLVASVSTLLVNTSFANKYISMDTVSGFYIMFAFQDFFLILLYLILAFLMYLIARVNKSLDGEFSLIPKLKKNKFD